MKKNKWLALALAMLMMLAFAAQAEGADANREVRLSLLLQDDGAALSGAQFSIYRVADVDAAGKINPLPPFDKYPVKLDVQGESGLAAAAGTLEAYVLRDQLAPLASAQTAADGRAVFPVGADPLPRGMYLVLGDRYVHNGSAYTFQPSLVQLPLWDARQEIWNYDVSVNAKFEVQPDAPPSSRISRKVLKVWKTQASEAALPEAVQVQLLQDGRVFDTVTLNAENNWRHTWTELDANHHWTVAEKEMEHCSVSITREGITFVVTNSYTPGEPLPTPTPATPSDPSSNTPKLPQTGQLWWPVPMLVFAGLLLIVIGLLRRRGN